MFPSLPPVTRAIIFINVLVFVLQHLPGLQLDAYFALWPVGTQFEPWQLLTYAFLHGSLAHIFFNMFALYMFGGALESFWGPRRFLLFYFVSVLAAAATQLPLQWLSQGGGEPVIGASGGIFGLLLAFAWFFPRQRILLLFPPIPMPAWLFVTLYGVLELVLGVSGAQSSVAHFAHLGGMLGGALMLLIWRARDSTRAQYRR